jgi:uncharacterized protein (DUF305 family)
MEQHTAHRPGSSPNIMYRKLLVMLLLSFAFMYLLMYAMVDRWANVVPNVNQFYMAGLMTMPMLVLEVVIMRSMYPSKKLNMILLVIGLAGMVAFFAGIQKQAGVGDRQFLRSMIPHHAAAVLMVKEAELSDPEIRKLAENIISSQQAEIQQMKDKLKELNK